MPNYSKMYCCSSLLISMYKYPVGRNITIYSVSAATDTNSRASPLQHMCARTHIHTYSVLFVLCVPVWQMCCFCGVWTDYHLPFIWGHEGAICYLDNEWCSLENLPITHSEETLMRPTALLPWRQEARFLTPWTHTIVFILFSALVVNFTHNLSFGELEQRYIELLCRWSQCTSQCSV